MCVFAVDLIRLLPLDLYVVSIKRSSRRHSHDEAYLPCFARIGSQITWDQYLCFKYEDNFHMFKQSFVNYRLSVVNI